MTHATVPNAADAPAAATQPTVGPRFRWLAALLPVLGLLALVVRSELAQRGGQFRLAIRGYDPRDLIAGHYLNYQYELSWQGPNSCGVTTTEGAAHLDSGCCVCLTRQAEHPAVPAASQVSCSEVDACDGWLYSEQLRPPKRYYVPEDRALELERALGGRKAAVDVVTSKSGSAAVGELYLDGMPWREALTKHVPASPATPSTGAAPQGDSGTE